jgi:hypothetical protein
MYKRFARFVGMLSISTLSAVVILVAFSAPTNPATPTLNPETLTAIPEDYADEDARVQVRQAVSAFVLPREYRVAISKDAKKLKGYKKSLYRGKYYHPDQENFRQCVMKRESHHNYRAANKSSSARGAYQFLDSQWRDGLVHMMVRESKKTDDGLIVKIKALKKKPIHAWNRYYQDRSFFTALNYNGKWSGKKHWNATVPGTGC